MYNPSEISATIKSSAQDKKVTVKQLLEDCKINKGFIYDLEHKSTYPSCDKISRIADYLDCSVDYLLGRENKISAPSNNDSAPDNVLFFNNDDLVTIRIAARNGGDIMEQTFTREQAEFIKLLVDSSPDSTDPRI